MTSSNIMPHGVLLKSLALMRELSKEYGAKEAHSIWERMTAIIDNADLKFEVFKIMMAGGLYGDTVYIKSHDGHNRIKCIRKWPGMGLKDSKAISDDAPNGLPREMQIDKSYLTASDGNRIDATYNEIVEDFGNAGFRIELR